MGDCDSSRYMPTGNCAALSSTRGRTLVIAALEPTAPECVARARARARVPTPTPQNPRQMTIATVRRDASVWITSTLSTACGGRT